MITVDPNRPHAAIPVDGSTRSDRTKRYATVATCRWCGRDIVERVAHMGQANHFAHLPKTFSRG